MKILELTPRKSSFESEVVAGLTGPRKQIPSKYLYDAIGSELFDKIRELGERQPQRTESAILRQHADDIATRLSGCRVLFELGSGPSSKTRLLLGRLGDLVAYAPIDISREMLEKSARRLERDCPGLEIVPVHADISYELTGLAERFEAARGGRLGYLSAATIGSFDPQGAQRLLSRAARLVGPEGMLVVGIDLLKEPETPEAACGDPYGVVAQFNLNLLRRMNRELGAAFDLDAFRHHAIFNALASRVELHLISLREQEVRVAGAAIRFRQGESIHTESSYRYSPARFERLAVNAGLEVVKAWTDRSAWFCIYLLRVASRDERATSVPVA